ncbi:serine/threonine-protein phosphatase 6 regulatory subunit 3 isoform X2 [Thrips palmi]|uniref:Serine/threonine-protein phosphatase 6 regulatory subunit 3 isoform X2 n=1 Tax=Thrips palmi TaxID=161013 RepID=A0A6P8ZHI8_THRPL|nr:serine/threonine-protein phosphatase 6 regulatory subunit 3 isoform X2 [Thrips palmi]
MFWKYTTTNSNSIETLLNKPDVTLLELMDEENILQECKVQNKRLVDFLIRPEVMEQLVTFATVEPPATLDEKTRFKYPNLACELLTSDVLSINEALAADVPLSKLYAFLEGEPPLNPLLASFFSKTLGILVARRSEQHWYSYQITCLKVIGFLQSKENCISLLLNHLGTSAIMDLMLKIITQVEGTEMRQNLIKWLQSQKVIPSLIGLLKPEVDSDRHSNVAQLLSDVIRKSRDNLRENPARDNLRENPTELEDPILTSLEKQETVAELLDNILSGEVKSESAIVGGIAVLLTLMETPQPRPVDTTPYADDGASLSIQEEEDVPPVPPVVHTTISAILPRLKDFHDLLLNPPQKPPVKTTVGTLDPPLGNTRLQVARLIAALIATNSPVMNQELANLGTIDVLLNLFFKYQWNNFLHTQVEQCVSAALKNQTKASGDGDPQMHCLVENLLVKCELFKRILDAWEENETNQVKEKCQRRGYMGHLIKIANLVVEQVEKCSLRPVLANQLPPEVLAVWEEFVKCTLSEINKTHNIALGGAPPTLAIGLDKEEANYKHVAFPPETSHHEAYTDYQLQDMAPNFNEHYGFHDNEFNDPEDTLHRWNLEKEVPEHSSSDEEEEGDDKDDDIRGPSKASVRMEVDVNDIWSSGAATLDSIADFQNPWGSGSPAAPPPADTFGVPDAGWADFSNFETNFSSSTQLNDAQKSQEPSDLFHDDMSAKDDPEDLENVEKMVVPDNTAISVETLPSTSEMDVKGVQDPISTSTGSSAVPIAVGVSFVKADANANPTTCTDEVTSTASAMVDEVATAAVAAVRVVVEDKLGLDNQRFLGGAQDESHASVHVHSEEDVKEPIASEDLPEKREIDTTTSEDLSSENV